MFLLIFLLLLLLQGDGAILAVGPDDSRVDGHAVIIVYVLYFMYPIFSDKPH